MTAPPTFQRRLLDSLPGDDDTAPIAREVVGACWSRVQPTPVAAPKMLHWSPGLAAEPVVLRHGGEQRAALVAGDQLVGQQRVEDEGAQGPAADAEGFHHGRLGRKAGQPREPRLHLAA